MVNGKHLAFLSLIHPFVFVLLLFWILSLPLSLSLILLYSLLASLLLFLGRRHLLQFPAHVTRRP